MSRPTLFRPLCLATALALAAAVSGCAGGAPIAP